MDSARTHDFDRFAALIESGDFESLDALLEPLHPADVAEIVEHLEPPSQIALIKRLDTETAAEVLAVVDEHSGQALLLLLSDREIVDLIEEMHSDDATDVLQTLPPEKTERVEALMETADVEELRELRAFDEESAGGIMEVEHVAVTEEATIGVAIEVVRASAEEIENVQKIYVVDDAGGLKGEFTVLDLLRHAPATPVSEVMETNVISVPVDMDQEAVANVFGKYDEFTLPVVDADNRLVGRITVDDIIDVIEEEASEDIARIAGTTEDEIGEHSVFKISRSRLPWLINSLIGQLIAALIMSQYEASLQELVVLTFFVPLIVGTAGSIGIQAAVVVVRELALGEIDVMRMGRRVLRELQVAAINGIVLAAILFVAVVAWRRDTGLGILLFGSLMLVIFVAAFIGASVPLLFQRWRIDPAIATGPFITVCNDIIGLAIYLSLASVYLTRTHP
jgi:magnesium transporter